MQAHEKIETSGKKIHFLVKNMEEDQDFELGEEKSIVLRVPKPAPPPRVKSAASIEARLREMQRKLSEIAEIPKILSSTLATVSQTFEILKPNDLQQQQLLQQCQQQRKYSYDEDALDYELSGASTVERLKLKAKGKAKANAAAITAFTLNEVRLEHLPKDATPESDYASEGNYESNEADTDDDYGDGEDGDEDGGGADISEASDEESDGKSTYTFALTGIDVSDVDAAETAQYSYVTRMRPAKLKQQKMQRKQQQNAQYQRGNVNVSAVIGVGVGGAADMSRMRYESKDYDEDDDDDDEGEGEEDTDDDVVTARLVAGDCGDSDDETAEDDYDDNDNDGANNRNRNDDDEDDFLTTTYTWNLRKIPKLQLNDEEKQSSDESNSVKDQIDMDDTDEEKPNKKARWCHADYDDLQQEKHRKQWAADEVGKEKKFSEKLERSWPWADREKIIYKQSTCHLVRRRPLGLVEQRIKLLAKQNLSGSLEKQLH
ncbi:nucleolin-like isoform X1 [Rhagoletis pomonella]|uniref:nucleolin-like isoform X1 n=1 Tax=Rhagoletis pomonella TaxID=28610 RepID=UPI001786D477|nr:nucleolin-like isoform X1 [Rhagoletis pomonella]